MNVTVFGSSKPVPGDALYEQAYQLGRMLAERNHAVLTGGYIGTMEAVSKGASAAGGHVIGVTCDEIENWRKVGANPWVKENRRVPTLHDRIVALIDGCEAAIALPGGVGTLTEIMLMWNRKVVAAIPPKPILLMGSGWKSIIASIRNFQHDYFSSADLELLKFCPDAVEAIEFIEKLNHSPLKH